MPSNNVSNRHIRVFISSTFNDMQGERTYLMKRVFPQLRNMAEKKDVTITEVDLRWGIQEEEVKNGRVVEICFREIEKSIPFFIGIVGNRYGWVPKKNELNDQVIEKYHNVESYLERRFSVTEMEIQFGVLQREEKMHAYFYIKENCDNESSSETENLEMLERLKHEIKNSGYPYEVYSSPRDLAEYVKGAFEILLETLFPEGKISELEKERIGQRSFLNQMCQNYVPDENNFKILDEWMNDWERHNMVITGESGLGKSALIANWIQRKIADKNRKYEIIYHFTGNGGSESSYEFIRKVLKDEIIDIYNFEQPEDSQESTLANLFVKIAKEQSRPLLIVLDAINQIYDIDNAKLLNWLPIPPKNVKILFSTLEEDRTMDVFKNRSYPLFVLKPLDIEKKHELVVRYLKDFGKTLTSDQVSQIITSPICENTLVLRTLLDELINYGIYEKIGNRIAYYSSQPSIDEFYQAILNSYEDEFSEDFVRHLLSLLVLSKNGLTENEILEISKTKPLYWSQFSCSFARNLTTKAGFVCFSHTFVKQAIVARYTQSEQRVGNYRDEIVSYFRKAPDNHRKWEELAFQYYSKNDQNALFQLLTQADVFLALYDKGKYELASYWSLLIENGYEMNACLQTIGTNTKETDLYKTLIVFARDVLGEYDIASRFCESFSQYLQAGKTDYSTIVGFYNHYGLLLKKTGNFQAAINQFNKALKIMEELGDQSKKKDRLDISRLYNNIGQVYVSLTEYEQAIDFLGKSLEIRIKELSKEHTSIATSYNNIGRVYRCIGKYDKALEYYNKALKIFIKKLGYSDPRIATLYNNLGAVYGLKGEYRKSLENSEKALKIHRQLLGDHHPDTATTLTTIGEILYKLNEYEKSKEHFLQALIIREESLGQKHLATANSYYDLGYVYMSMGEMNNALSFFKKNLQIIKEIWGSNHLSSAPAYRSLGEIYYRKSEYEIALKYFRKALGIQKKGIGIKHRGTAGTIKDIGLTFLKKGDNEKASKYLEKAREIYEELLECEHPAVASIYYNLGKLYFKEEKYDLAYEYSTKSLKIRKAKLPPPHPDIAKSEKIIQLINQKK